MRATATTPMHAETADKSAPQPAPAPAGFHARTLTSESGTTTPMNDTKAPTAHVTAWDKPTMTVLDMAGVLGVSREAAYDAVRRGDIPSIRVGRKILIPTAKLAAMLGIAAGGQAGAHDEG